MYKTLKLQTWDNMAESWKDHAINNEEPSFRYEMKRKEFDALVSDARNAEMFRAFRIVGIQNGITTQIDYWANR